MKLIDDIETILIVVGVDRDADSPDRAAADLLREEVDRRGGGHPYRRAVVMTDHSWLDTRSLRHTPTIAIGGPGVNLVCARFAAEMDTVWTDEEHAVIQAEISEGTRRAALWGSKAFVTRRAVDAFIARGWLEEFLTVSWRFRVRTYV